MPVDQQQLWDALTRGVSLVLGDGSRPEWTPAAGESPPDRIVSAVDLPAVLLDAEADW